MWIALTMVFITVSMLCAQFSSASFPSKGTTWRFIFTYSCSFIWTIWDFTHVFTLFFVLFSFLNKFQIASSTIYNYCCGRHHSSYSIKLFKNLFRMFYTWNILWILIHFKTSDVIFVINVAIVQVLDWIGFLFFSCSSFLVFNVCINWCHFYTTIFISWSFLLHTSHYILRLWRLLYRIIFLPWCTLRLRFICFHWRCNILASLFFIIDPQIFTLFFYVTHLRFKYKYNKCN